ncbi:MAG TPA: hypothetical protein VNB29_04255 [Chthoniobacterales bacterium]|nr:hypothetical protein [Chthoniobacterales bacterium]
MKRKIGWLMTLGMACAGMVFAQSARVPSGELLKRTPDYSAWTITVTYPGAPAPTAEAGGQDFQQVQQVSVTKTKPLWHAVSRGKGGIISDRWGDARQTFAIMPKTALASILTRGEGSGKFEVPDQLTVGYDKRDFPDMEWVSAGTYKGSIKGGKVLIFQESGGQEATVYIDAESRLPIRWQKPGEVRDFRFLSAPDVPLVFPAQVTATLETMKKIYDATDWPPKKK